MYGIRSTKSNTTSANSLASPSDSAPLSTSFLECFKAVKDQDGCIIYYFGFINILYNIVINIDKRAKFALKSSFFINVRVL